MANNFVNGFASIVTAGENYQSVGSITDNHTGPQLVYKANNGTTGVNSILVELDAANTGTASISITCFIVDDGSKQSCGVTSATDVATVTKNGHGLQTGQYVFVSGSSDSYVNGFYKITRVDADTFTYQQNAAASDNGSGYAGTIVYSKAYSIVKDVTIPVSSTLKIVSGQKIVLNADDKVYAYASAAHCDVIAGVLQEVD